MIDDIRHATGGRHMRWVMVDEVARRLGLDDAAVDAAIRQAEAKGLLVAEGSPPHSICLKAAGGFGS
jgi:DNA-binding MarR family transcriptional regulator